MKTHQNTQQNAQMKKNNNKSEDNLALPQFGCKCGLEYSTLSSLSNHIKIMHNNNTEEFKLKRGVPEGRRQRLNPLLKETIQKMIKQNEKIKKDAQGENLSINESRGIFMQNIKYIDQLVEKYNLTKQQEIILQKEHIKFQEVWNDLDISSIQNQTQIYLNAYCCVFFKAPHILLKKEEEEIEEEQQQKQQQKQNNQNNEEQNSDHLFFYFYKNLLTNHKPNENNEFKQSSSQSSSPKAAVAMQQNDKPIIQNNNNNNNSDNNNSNQVYRNIPTNYKNSSNIITNSNAFNNCNNKISDNNNSNNNQEDKISTSISHSPNEEKYFVNIHPSLNINDDQYMLNFFKKHLIDDKKKKLQSQHSCSSSSS